MAGAAAMGFLDGLLLFSEVIGFFEGDAEPAGRLGGTGFFLEGVELLSGNADGLELPGAPGSPAPPLTPASPPEPGFLVPTLV
jgi:hypothetical protein